MSQKLSLPQNGLQVGNQIITDGDTVTLGNNVGVGGDLRVGGSIFANRIAAPFVTKTHTTTTNLVIDCNYTQHYITLSANPSGITFTNVPDKSVGNYTITVYMAQDTTGNRKFTWSNNPNIMWPNLGLSTNNYIYPTLQTLPNKLDVFKFITFDGGNNWVGYQENPVQYQLADLATLQNKASNSIIQVVQGVKKDTWSVAPANGSTYYPVTGLTATITPKYQSSSILVCSSIYMTTGYYAAEGKLLRNGSDFVDSFGIQRGSRTPCTFVCNTYSGSAGGWNWYTPSFSYLDTTNRTDNSAITYGVSLSSYSTYSIGVNINVYDDSNSSDYMGCPISTITLYEVATV